METPDSYKLFNVGNIIIIITIKNVTKTLYVKISTNR